MRTCLAAILAIASLSSFAVPVAATEADEAVPVFTDTAAAAEPLQAAPADAVPADFATPLAVDALDRLRGGADVQTTTNLSDLDGRVDGNTATDVVTGTNLVDGGAFGAAAGISTVIQNSGNNVLIQNSTIVNVQFVPTP